MAMLLGLVRPNRPGPAPVLGEPLGHPERYLGRVGGVDRGSGAVARASNRAPETCVCLPDLARTTFAASPTLLDQVGLLGPRADDRFGGYFARDEAAPRALPRHF